MTMEVLDRPSLFEDKSGPAIWVDEAIWGHRLHDEQSPWLTFLEFLTVLLAEHEAGRPLVEGELNTLSYRPKVQLKLRNLVLNTPHLVKVRVAHLSDAASWQLWLQTVANPAGGIDTQHFYYQRKQ